MEFNQGTLFNEINSYLFLCFSCIYSTIQLISDFLLLLPSNKPTLETPTTYYPMTTDTHVPTPNVAMENDIDMMVICTCSRR